MRCVTFASLLFVVAISPGFADVSVGTAAFLKEIGIDPSSVQVTDIADDVVNNKSVQGVSLNSLAAKHDEYAVKSFILMRNFIHKYVTDASTPPPPDEVYRVEYLTETEKELVACNISLSFGIPCGGRRPHE